LLKGEDDETGRYWRFPSHTRSALHRDRVKARRERDL
jgi:hypothetical protein